MKKCGGYSFVCNDNKQEQKENYDIDHVINDVIKQLDDAIDSADINSGFKSIENQNYNTIIKASINHLLDKIILA